MKQLLRSDLSFRPKPHAKHVQRESIIGQYLSIIRVGNYAIGSVIGKRQDQWQRSCQIRRRWHSLGHYWCVWWLSVDSHHSGGFIIVCGYSLLQLHRWILHQFWWTVRSGTLTRLWRRTREYAAVVGVFKALVGETCRQRTQQCFILFRLQKYFINVNWFLEKYFSHLIVILLSLYSGFISTQSVG